MNKIFCSARISQLTKAVTASWAMWFMFSPRQRRKKFYNINIKGLFYPHFCGCNLWIFVMSYFVPGKPFQPILMFVGEDRRLERLARDKHSSLSRKSMNYDRKKVYRTGP
jgi:hypothetical protein